MPSCLSWPISGLVLALALAACGQTKIVTEVQPIELVPGRALLACPAPLPRLPANPRPTNAQMVAWAEQAYQGHLACHARVEAFAALYSPDR